MKAYTKYGMYATDSKAGILIVNGDSISIESRRTFGGFDDWRPVSFYDFLVAYNTAMAKFNDQIAEKVREGEEEAETEWRMAS